MSIINKFAKRILKQYGKNIRAFEGRDLDPSKETLELWKKIQKETSSNKQNPKRKPLQLSEHKPMLSILHTRWGFASRDKNTFECHDDLVTIASVRVE